MTTSTKRGLKSNNISEQHETFQKRFLLRKSQECCMYPFLGTSTLKDCRQSDGLGEEPRMRDGRLKDLRTG